MLVESLVPHETTGVVWPIGYACEQSIIAFLDNHAVLENHAVAVHVAHRAKHVAEGVLAGGKLLRTPFTAVAYLLFTEMESFLDGEGRVFLGR